MDTNNEESNSGQQIQQLKIRKLNDCVSQNRPPNTPSRAYFYRIGPSIALLADPSNPLYRTDSDCRNSPNGPVRLLREVEAFAAFRHNRVDCVSGVDLLGQNGRLRGLPVYQENALQFAHQRL